MDVQEVLDHIDRTHKGGWFSRRHPASPLQVAVAQLELTRKDQLEHASKQEYHSAMTKMLADRERRLLKDIDRLKHKLPSGTPIIPISGGM